jgi:hypothetical protein
LVDADFEKPWFKRLMVVLICILSCFNPGLLKQIFRILLVKGQPKAQVKKLMLIRFHKYAHSLSIPFTEERKDFIMRAHK